MSSKRRYGMGDHDLLVSAISEKKEMENEYGVVAYTTIGFSDRLGVLVVRTEVRPRGASLSVKPLATYEGTWPNAQPIGWPAYLFQHFTRLAMQVGDCVAPLIEN